MPNISRMIKKLENISAMDYYSGIILLLQSCLCNREISFAKFSKSPFWRIKSSVLGMGQKFDHCPAIADMTALLSSQQPSKTRKSLQYTT